MGCAASAEARDADTGDVKLQRGALGGIQAIDCEVLFFPDPALPCRSFLSGGALCKRPGCRFAHETTSLVKLLALIGRAKRTLEVCVFTITCNEIADEIEAAAKRGVMVRIITDDEQAKSQGSDVTRLGKVSNVAVRHDGDAKSHMHHKFAIIDNRILLTGSFNWTRSAVLHNKENVLCTDVQGLVQPYREEFRNLWKQFRP